MNEPVVAEKSQLLPQLDGAWRTLEELIDGLSDEQMTSIKDSEGWTVKDHIAHLTDWERSAVFFLRGVPRHLAMGIDEAVYLRGTEEEINELMQNNDRETPLDDVLANFRQVHQELLSLLDKLQDEDLQKPYRHYLPQEVGDGGDRPAMNVVYGNTVHHFREHQEWIESLINEQAGKR